MTLEDAINYTVSMYQEHCNRECKGLPGYWEKCLKCETYDALMTTKRALTRREPKKPVNFNCPECGAVFAVGVFIDNKIKAVDYKPKYCEKCGQAIKWED